MLSVISTLALAGCQTASGPLEPQQSPADQLASYVGSTLDVFERAAIGLHPVSARDTPEGRIFLYESDPVIVTTTLPPYVPPPRTYSDPNFGVAANGLTAALGTVPGVSRSRIQKCRVYLLAKRIDDAPRSASWRIEQAELQGAC